MVAESCGCLPSTTSLFYAFSYPYAESCGYPAIHHRIVLLAFPPCVVSPAVACHPPHCFATHFRTRVPSPAVAYPPTTHLAAHTESIFRHVFLSSGRQLRKDCFNNILCAVRSGTVGAAKPWYNQSFCKLPLRRWSDNRA